MGPSRLYGIEDSMNLLYIRTINISWKLILWTITRERTGKTNERTTVVDTNSLTSRGLLTLKKTIPGTKKKFLAI